MQNETVEYTPQAEWAIACGIPRNQLMSQIKVMFQEMNEIIEGILEKSPQEIMDGVTDVDWMLEMIDYLLDDTAKELVGDADLRAEFNNLLDIVEKHYPGLLGEYLLSFREAVRVSNFSKFCKTEEEAEESVEEYKRNGVEVSYREVDGLYVLYSTKDQDDDYGKHYNKNKILKSINYAEPNITVQYTNPLYYRKLTKEDLVDLIMDVRYMVVDGTTTTVCAITLKGSYVVTGTSACINPDDYVYEDGKKYAFEDAISKVWDLEGYKRIQLAKNL